MLPGSISFSLPGLCESNVETKARGDSTYHGASQLCLAAAAPVVNSLQGAAILHHLQWENVHFRAHKVVLAAASLLFKSLLDSTDTISHGCSCGNT